MTDYASEFAQVSAELENHVLTITLQRPEKLNAVTQEMSAALERIIARTNDDPGVRAIVYTGAGRAFSAGSDIRTLDRYETPWEFRNRRDYCDVGRGREFFLKHSVEDSFGHGAATDKGDVHTNSIQKMRLL